MIDSQNKPVMSAINISGPAEILRTEQKDLALCEQINQQLSDLLVHLKGHIFVNKNKLHIFSASQILYYALTTLSKLQTMGEQYTKIIQVGSTRKHAPGILLRAGMISAHVFGEQLIVWALNRFVCYVRDNKSITLQAKNQIIQFVTIIKSSVPLLLSLNRVSFYWNGSYYTLAKRLFNIRYIYAVPWYHPKKNPKNVFKWLSVVTAIELSVHVYNIVFKNPTVQINDCDVDEYSEELDTSSSSKCSLCLGPRENTSLSFCGHLFCWFCIHKWLQTNDFCPICHKTLDPRKIVPLQNYN